MMIKITILSGDIHRWSNDRCCWAGKLYHPSRIGHGLLTIYPMSDYICHAKNKESSSALQNKKGQEKTQYHLKRWGTTERKLLLQGLSKPWDIEVESCDTGSIPMGLQRIFNSKHLLQKHWQLHREACGMLSVTRCHKMQVLDRAVPHGSVS